MGLPERRVLIRVDAGGQVGHGHAYRMAALAGELRRAGAEVEYLTSTPELADLVAPAVVHTEAEPDLLGRAGGYDATVIDMPDPPGEVRGVTYVVPRSHPWPGLPAPEDYHHVLLRPQFRRPQVPRSKGRTPQRIYLSAGGCDAAGLRATIEGAGKALARRRSCELVWVDGEKSDVAALMDTADLAVVTYGMTALECAARGLPSVTVSPTEHHEAAADCLERVGASLSLGHELRTNHEVVAKAADTLLEDHRRLGLMTQTGPRLIDGLGARRVAERILRSIDDD